MLLPLCTTQTMSDQGSTTQSDFEKDFGSQADLKQKSVGEKKHNIRWVMLVQIIVFLTSGLLLIVMGTVMIAQDRTCNRVTYVSVYWPCVLTIIAGVFVLALSCMDTLTLQSSRARDMRSFVMVLFVVISFQCAAIITSAVKVSQLGVGGALHQDMLESMALYGGEDERIAQCWDRLQSDNACCGTDNFTDWATVAGIRSQTVPSSCHCNLDDPFVDCEATVNSTLVYSNGCYGHLANITSYHFDVIQIVNGFMIIVSIVAAFVTLCTGCRIFRQSVVATYVVET